MIDYWRLIGELLLRGYLDWRADDPPAWKRKCLAAKARCLVQYDRYLNHDPRVK